MIYVFKGKDKRTYPGGFTVKVREKSLNKARKVVDQHLHDIDREDLIKHVHCMEPDRVLPEAMGVVSSNVNKSSWIKPLEDTDA